MALTKLTQSHSRPQAQRIMRKQLLIIPTIHLYPFHVRSTLSFDFCVSVSYSLGLSIYQSHSVFVSQSISLSVYQSCSVSVSPPLYVHLIQSHLISVFQSVFLLSYSPTLSFYRLTTSNNSLSKFLTTSLSISLNQSVCQSI